MELIKGDKVKYSEIEGIVVSNSYINIFDKQKYINVYFENSEQVSQINVKLLEKM